MGPRLLLLTNGRYRAMPWNHQRVVRQRVEASNRFDQLAWVATRKVRAGDPALKEGVAGAKPLGGGYVEGDRTLAMTGDVQNGDWEPGNRFEYLIVHECERTELPR